MFDIYLSIFSVVFPLVLLISLGSIARKFDWIHPNADHSLTKILINLFYPSLLFSVIVRNQGLREGNNLWLPPLLGFLFVICGYAISYLIAKIFVSPSDKIAARSFAFTSGLSNYGYFAIPIASIASLFLPETVGILAIFNLGIEIGLWSIGMMILTGKNNLRALINMPCISIVLAIICNVSGISNYLPSIFTETLRLLAACTIPIALIIVGALIFDNFHHIPLKLFWKIPASGIAIRLIIFPIAGIFLAKILPVNQILKQVLVIQCAMPCATFPMVLIRQYGGETTTAFLLTVATTIAGLIFIPIWIMIGMSLI